MDHPLPTRMTVEDSGVSGGHRLRELEVFAESSRLLSSTLDLGEVLDHLARVARERLAVDLVRIWLVDRATGDVVLRTQTGMTREHVSGARRLALNEGLAGWVLAHREPLVVSALPGHPRLTDREWFAAEGIESMMVVPLLLDGEPVGVLSCLSRARREFTDGDVALAVAVAAPAALAVRNAAVHTEALERLDEIHAFQRITAEILSAPDLDSVLHVVVREARALLQADAAFCSLLDPDGVEVGPLAASGTRSDQVVRYRLTQGEGLTRLLVSERRTLRTDDYLSDTRFLRTPALEGWARAEGVRTMIAAPALGPAGDPCALLWAFNRTPTPFTPRHEQTLATLAQQAALAIGKARGLEEERRRASETSALLDIARASTSTLDLRPLLAELASRTAQALEAERCTISLWRDGHLVPVMAQFADGHQDPVLWAKFRELGGAGLERALPDLEASGARQAVVVPDTAGSSLFPADWVRAFGVRSLLVSPLISKDRMVGTLSLDDTRGPRQWTASQVNLAMTIGAQVALALDTARQHRETQQRAAEVEALATTGEALASTLELEAVLEIIADSAMTLVGAQRAVVFELDQETEQLHARAVRGIDMQPGLVLRLGQGAAGTAAFTRRPVSSADVLADPPAGYDQVHEQTGLRLGDLVQTWGYRAVLSVPVLSRDHVLGAVGVFWDEVHQAKDRDVRLLSALARQAAIALDKARLVADLRRTLAELRAAQDSLVRGATLRAVGELAAGAAHHLNNLLAVVLGRTQLLLMRGVAPAARQGLETIERATMDAAETVRRIQAFGRTEPDAQVAPFDVNAVVEESLALSRFRWQGEAQAQGIRIDVAFERGAVPSVPGRSAEIREVIANLILNAVDAVATGGRIVVRTAHEPGRVIVSIGDSGSGMSEEVRRRAFEPFFTTKGVKRTGLGLAVAYGTVRRHGGEIGVDTVEGQGTTVTFWLPTKSDTSATAAAPSGDRGTVLVIDDEATVRDILVEVLTTRGHLVAAAAGGHEGLARFEAGRYDLVLTDLGMPDMTGWDVARAVKTARPSTPVLLVTGWGDELDAPPGVLVEGIITKPFDVARLCVAVEEALRRSRRSAPTV